MPERESTADVLISRTRPTASSRCRRARVGTGSLRRKAQLLHLRPDLIVEDIRGNVETRLRKLDEGEFDAIVLAEAGLKRLGWPIASRVIPRSTMLPAVGQGALAIETRGDDERTRIAASRRSTTRVASGRCWPSGAAASHLRAGCLAPVGAWAASKTAARARRGRPQPRRQAAARRERLADIADAVALGPAGGRRASSRKARPS